MPRQFQGSPCLLLRVLSSRPPESHFSLARARHAPTQVPVHPAAPRRLAGGLAACCRPRRRGQAGPGEPRRGPPALQDPPGIGALKYRSIGPAWGGRVSRACGRAGRSAHLLRRHGVRRRLEVDRRRHRPGSRSSTTSRSPRSARSPSRRPTPTSSTSAPARPTSAATSRPATASTSRPTPARPGSTSGSRTGRSARWSSIRRTPTSPSRPCSATPSAPTPSAASTAPRDGGKTWQQVLKKDADTGASDVAIDPVEPAASSSPASGRRAASPWEMTSGGPGSGLYVSRDGGDTWKQLDRRSGLPGGHLGQGRRRGRAVGRPARLRPDRGGEGRALPLRRRRRDLDAGQRRPRAAPARLVLLDAHRRPDEPGRGLVPAGAAAQEHRRRQDASSTSRASTTATTTTCGSIPKNPKRMIDANDGGVDITTNGGETWFAPPLPIGQFYHVVVDNRVPYHVAGAHAGHRHRRRGRATASSRRHPPRATGTASAAARPATSSPTRPIPNIVYAGEYLRHHHALRPPHRPGAQRQRLARQPLRPRRPRT